MEIIKIETSKIRMAEYNPRVALKPGDSEFEKLDRSIKEFGFVEPAVWNKRTGNLVGGHQRLAVLKAQGVTEVEVSVVDLPLEKEKALNIALNKIKGGWDEEKLAGILQELSQVPDFDVSLTGFESVEISQLFDEYLTPDPEDDFDLKKEAAEGIITPITQKGDLIELGRHRLLCGDSSSPEDLKRLLGDQKVRLLHTDPPYNCRYDSTCRPGQDKSDSKWKPIANDWAEQTDYEAWLAKFFETVKPHLAEGAPLYVWNGHRQFGPMHAILTNLGFHVSNVITWVKPSASPGYADYKMQSEFCLYAWLEGNGSHHWFGGNSESNVWECPRDAAHTLIHPTTKPVALAQRAIKNSSQRGDLILDCFAGSGSTIMAAQSMERVCCAMELEPAYCDAIVRRFIKKYGHESISAEIR
ncbi:MAG TPA: site-specific DNA-methyltransferase, partial [Candidatus Omnitrophota bacterium]|nr:site-specific DNA-methyltransferase [Candidatus Omnitrophota bacterium]